jgi:hypothetical protein
LKSLTQSATLTIEQAAMDKFEYADLPEILTLGEGVEVLAAVEDEHGRLFDKAVVRDHNEVHAIDHIIATVLKRSIAHIRAFLLLMDSGNEFAAMPLIRMQLDSVLRISAFRLVNKPSALAQHMIEGNKFDKYKENDNKPDLRDKALRTPLEVKYEYINELYEMTSGYVHLSQHHLIRVVKDWDKPGRAEDERVEFGSIEELPSWKQSDKREAMVLFCATTRFLLDEADEVLSAPRSEESS